jgi:hypothetical protein
MGEYDCEKGAYLVKKTLPTPLPYPDVPSDQ